VGTEGGKRRWTARTRATERGKWVRGEERDALAGGEGGEVDVETVSTVMVYMFFTSWTQISSGKPRSASYYGQ